MKKIFLIIQFFVFTFFFLFSCSFRDEGYNDNNTPSIYKVDIIYSGDIQNWNDELSVTVAVDPGNTPHIRGLNGAQIQRVYEKIDEEANEDTYKFALPLDNLKNKAFITSKNAKRIRLSGLVTPNNNAAEISVIIKAYKNGRLIGEFSFKFDRNSVYPYYNVVLN